VVTRRKKTKYEKVRGRITHKSRDKIIRLERLLKRKKLSLNDLILLINTLSVECEGLSERAEAIQYILERTGTLFENILERALEEGSKVKENLPLYCEDDEIE